jgi:hypothetical protein
MMKQIELNKKTYHIPSAWNELSQKQLLKLMDILYSNQDAGSALLQIFRILTCMTQFTFFSTRVKDMEDFLYLCEFLLEKNTLTKNLIPIHEGFAGPKDDFGNLTGLEFVCSEDYYFRAFTKDHPDAQREMSIEMLNEFVAVLYRPIKDNYNIKIDPDGDIRSPFNENICHYHAVGQIRYWPLQVKLAIFTWYEGCRQKMIEENPDVFDGGSGEPAKYGLLSVMRTIAETGIHGDFDKVQKMFVKMWMIELNEKAEEVKQLKKANNV